MNKEKNQRIVKAHQLCDNIIELLAELKSMKFMLNVSDHIIGIEDLNVKIDLTKENDLNRSTIDFFRDIQNI